MNRSQDEMKYLASRAKKMVGRLTNRELPSAEKLRERFAAKGEELSGAEAQMLWLEIRTHRGLECSRKPEAKAEVAPPQKTSTRFCQAG